MGFTTKNQDTTKVTFVERDDVNQWVAKFAEEQGWDLSDVRNRAIMYYAKMHKEGKLNDPKVDDGNGRKKGLELDQ